MESVKRSVWDFPGCPLVKTPCFQKKRFHASNAGDAGSISGGGTKTPRAAWRGQKKGGGGSVGGDRKTDRSLLLESESIWWEKGGNTDLCFLFFIFLVSHKFYTHQCIHVNPNRPIQHTTIPTPPRFSPLGVHTFVLYICVSTSALQTSSSVPFF